MLDACLAITWRLLGDCSPIALALLDPAPSSRCASWARQAELEVELTRAPEARRVPEPLPLLQEGFVTKQDSTPTQRRQKHCESIAMEAMQIAAPVSNHHVRSSLTQKGQLGATAQIVMLHPAGNKPDQTKFKHHSRSKDYKDVQAEHMCNLIRIERNLHSLSCTRNQFRDRP